MRRGSYRSQYFFGAQNGRCGLTKPTREEERLIGRSFAALQPANGFVRELAVGIGVVGHVGDFDTPRRAGSCLAPLGHVGEAAPPRASVLPARVLRQRVGDDLGLPVRHAPRGGVLVVAVADVKDLAQRLGAVAVLLEVLRQRHRVRRGLAEVRAEIVDAERVRPQAGEQRVARRRADRLVAVGAFEQHAARREPVDVRRLRQLVAVAAERRLQIVDQISRTLGRFAAAPAGGPPAVGAIAPAASASRAAVITSTGRLAIRRKPAAVLMRIASHYSNRSVAAPDSTPLAATVEVTSRTATGCGR